MTQEPKGQWIVCVTPVNNNFVSTFSFCLSLCRRLEFYYIFNDFGVALQQYLQLLQYLQDDSTIYTVFLHKYRKKHD